MKTKKIFQFLGFTLAAFALAGCETTGSLKEVMTKIKTNVNDFQNKVTGGESVNPKLFEVIGDGPSQFKDIFKNTKRPDIYSNPKDTGWPRVAITYVEWGKDMICWKVRADIWKSQKIHIIENMKICDVPYIMKDALGTDTEFTEKGWLRITALMKNATASAWHNTNLTRTTGPVPPKYPWKVDIVLRDLITREEAIATRIALISGWYDHDDKITTSSYIDARLWFVKFETKQ
jgi:hypothetical protein